MMSLLTELLAIIIHVFYKYPAPDGAEFRPNICGSGRER
jgi:hypothetical protein